MLNIHALVHTGFMVLPLAMALLVSWAAGSRRLTFSIFTWMLIGAALALSGLLNRFSATPPPIAPFVISGFIGTIAIGMSSWVRRLIELPLAALIAAQAFRILVEILIHESSTIGLAPPQMTWNGYNFDVITGVTALALAPFARTVPTRLVLIWNYLGLALLIWVVGVAIISFPTRFQLLRPDNTWVASFPYVWLPSILVPAALLGHVVIFRKLATKRIPDESVGHAQL